MYGEGANYNTMEHKFRGYRKDAEALHAEASGRLGTDAAPSAENSPEKSSGAQVTTQKNGKGAKAAKVPRAKAAKKKAPASPQDSDEEGQPKRKKARASPKKSQKSMDVEKVHPDTNSDAGATLDALMKTSGVYSELGLDMEDL
jgi:hypothetical protein